MNLKILNHAISLQEDADSVLKRPVMRKATKNMAFGVAAIEKTIESLSSILKDHSDEIGFILVSNTGELESTLEFLKTLYSTKVARPLLFQNSLHNATAGFLTIQFGLKAPALSISPSPFGEEQALETAEILIAGNQCRYCIIVSIDIWPNIDGIPYSKDDTYNGATCLFVAAANDTKYKAKFEINKLYFKETSFENEPQWSLRTLKENTFFQLSSSLSKEKTGTLHMQKNQGESIIQWSECL